MRIQHVDWQTASLAMLPPGGGGSSHLFMTIELFKQKAGFCPVMECLFFRRKHQLTVKTIYKKTLLSYRGCLFTLHRTRQYNAIININND